MGLPIVWEQGGAGGRQGRGAGRGRQGAGQGGREGGGSRRAVQCWPEVASQHQKDITLMTQPVSHQAKGWAVPSLYQGMEDGLHSCH